MLDFNFKLRHSYKKIDRREIPDLKIPDFKMSFKKFVPSCISKHHQDSCCIQIQIGKLLSCFDLSIIWDHAFFSISVKVYMCQCNRISEDSVDDAIFQHEKLVEKSNDIALYSPSVRLRWIFLSYCRIRRHVSTQADFEKHTFFRAKRVNLKQLKMN